MEIKRMKEINENEDYENYIKEEIDEDYNEDDDWEN